MKRWYLDPTGYVIVLIGIALYTLYVLFFKA